MEQGGTRPSLRPPLYVVQELVQLHPVTRRIGGQDSLCNREHLVLIRHHLTPSLGHVFLASVCVSRLAFTLFALLCVISRFEYWLSTVLVFDPMLFYSLQIDQMLTRCLPFLAWGLCGFPERDPVSEATVPLRRRILASVREGRE